MNLAKLTQRIEKAKTEGKQYVTIRYDVVKRMILKGEYSRMVCRYRYTDDYYYDNENNFGKGDLTPERARYVAENEMTRGVHCYVNVDEPKVITIRIYYGLVYDLYLK